MKGLVLKDIYGVWFQILGGLAIMLFPVIVLLFGFEENISDFKGTAVEILPFGMVNYISVTICSSFLLNTLGYDEKSGWSKMQRAMPLSGGKIIGAKFCTMGLVLGAITALSLVFNILYTTKYGIALEPMIVTPLVMCLLQAITLSPTFALGYRFSSIATSAVYMGFVVLVAAAVIWLVFMIFADNIGTTALRIICYAVLPVLTVAVVAVSWVTGKKAVMIDI